LNFFFLEFELKASYFFLKLYFIKKYMILMNKLIY
jgi:hypothetical protein